MTDKNYLPFVDDSKNVYRLSYNIKNIPKSRLVMKIMHEKKHIKTRGYYLHINVITFNECGIEYNPSDHKVVFIEEAQRHCKNACYSAAQIAAERAANVVSRLYPDLVVEWSKVYATPSKALSPVLGIYMDEIHYLD